VSAHSAGAYTATLLVMVSVMKGGGRAPPHSHQPGLILPSCWNVRQKAAVATLCVLCGPDRQAQHDRLVNSRVHGGQPPGRIIGAWMVFQFKGIMSRGSENKKNQILNERRWVNNFLAVFL
jgi:hypothetical protein